MKASKIEEAIGFYWGERCPDKHTDCVICQAWSEYDVLNLALRLVAVETAIEIEKWKLKKEQA
tara:strand:- start:350 stop:538 length:189 start_codon:yes stop_codon:yes gene_type:complete